jgi:inorganic pyrophosphatase
MKLPKTFTGKKEHINVIIETPKDSRNKYTFDPDTQLFKLSKAFPVGMFFPVDFGFIPHTLAEDGDPMDVLVFMDDPTYPGCLVECKVLGIIEAEQEENDKMIRNDRVLAAAVESRVYSSVESYKDLEEKIIEDIIQFFINYHKRSGDKFKPLDTSGPGKAIKLIKKLCNHGYD